ncbi:MAG: hypothetical protein QN151_10765 [Armatimonadota bacterium]|nr:hypothetical protein [Armatimonadota bacterium]
MNGVTWMCREPRVSPSGDYAWRSRRPSRRRQGDQELVERMRGIWEGSGRTYGPPGCGRSCGLVECGAGAIG